ncbi:MAG TPA: FKBP-type peptidyl-prolyl cis-trans isomerase [Polyangiaceae bacterium]|jgi:FKBP-type peptidyl-prolyl cis-trans isomerase|nr:FKBP-type peptidyl-prolyl cis-trans isomerase [Polyangiaceae bacterium]
MKSFLPALALSVALAAGCRPAEPARPEASSTAKPADDLPPMLPGIEKKDVAVGEGPGAKKGDRVSVHYTGRLLDGTKFDSSLDRGTPFEFVIGQQQVIEGWDDGVVGMKKGGKRTLKIPPHLGYGHNGSPPKIPADATLLFDIEMLDIMPSTPEPAPPQQ